MKIIEMNVTSKTGNSDDCEDGIVVTDDFAAVIDGATSKSRNIIQNTTTGRHARNILMDAVRRLPRDADCKLTFETLNQTILNSYQSLRITDSMLANPAERFSAAIVIYSRHYHQVWSLGDSKFLTSSYLHETETEADRILARTRSLFLELEIQSGKTIQELMENDTGRAYILPLLKRKISLQNSRLSPRFAHFILDGFFEQHDAVFVMQLDHKEPFLVLASDGYPALHSSLSDSEKHLQHLLHEDPLCFKIYRSTKGLKSGNVSFDDRAFVKIQLHEA
ncbi:hypothetical protein [Alteribacter natronophilus]|uniref:hypothetical protein n=1 Tax=Alteribacter natronophilus TaxID=2583810 RepID=UPI00110EFEB3|nr:hypothetical protein [Alteribacter natronophilus]TMW72252.1 hypothetical protein FGB90_08555 [Alteribacter natronophilus]